MVELALKRPREVARDSDTGFVKPSIKKSFGIDIRYFRKPLRFDQVVHPSQSCHLRMCQDPENRMTDGHKKGRSQMRGHLIAIKIESYDKLMMV